MNREVHVRVWERAEVKFLRATRQKHALPQCNGKGRFTPISGLRPLRDHPKRVASLHSTPESLRAA